MDWQHPVEVTATPHALWRREAEVAAEASVAIHRCAAALPADSEFREQMVRRARAWEAFARGRGVTPPMPPRSG